MTDTQEKTTALAQKPALVVGKPIQAVVPENIEEAFRLATAITQADMAPKSYGRNAQKVMIGMLSAMEVGRGPMWALKNVAVINNQSCIWGEGVLDLLQSSGALEDLIEVTEGEGDNRTAKCTMKRRNQRTPYVGTFSIAQARTAGLLNKDPWQKYPDDMLMWRARHRAARIGFADALGGLRFPEETVDAIELLAGEEYKEIENIPAAPPRKEDFAVKEETKLIDFTGEEIGSFVESENWVEDFCDTVSMTPLNQIGQLRENNLEAINNFLNDDQRSRAMKALIDNQAFTDAEELEQQSYVDEPTARPELVIKLPGGRVRTCETLEEWKSSHLHGISVWKKNNKDNLKNVRDLNADVFTSLANVPEYAEAVEAVMLAMRDALD
jgi:hypothetical protein|tara:strand:+ start:275 stop:1423 length:1149 start_codon:yes stop_codon:yes gene_type:complete